MKKYITIIIIVILIIYIGIGIYNRRVDNSKNDEVKEYIEYPVQKGNLTEVIDVSGHIKPKKYRLLYPEISGKIVEIYKKDGDYVNVGDPILKIDDKNYYIAYLNAKQSYESVKGQGTLEEDIKKAQYEKSKKEFESTIIKAPISGKLINFDVELGNSIGTSSIIGVIIDESKYEFVGYIDLIDYPKVEVGQKLSLTIDGYFNKPIMAVVNYISSGDLTSNNVTVAEIRADLILNSTGLTNSSKIYDSSEEKKVLNKKPNIMRTAEKNVFNFKIFSGISAEGQIYALSKENILKIPLSALKTLEGKTYVLVKNNQSQPEKIEIKVGTITESFIEVVEGLKEGDVVLIEYSKSSTLKKSPIPTGRVLRK
ncbi:efflux RND transporter periplasmic adaptor subunit [Marinitoga arctica]